MYALFDRLLSLSVINLRTCLFVCLLLSSIFYISGSLPTACSSRERLVAPEGAFTSPNFPGPYPANSSCVWIITPPQNTNLSLEFTSFNIQSNAKECGGSKCHCDFVQVKELDPPTNSAGFSAKFCNDNRPRRIINNLMSRVRIRFVSDLAGEETGFKLTYKTFQSSPTSGPGGGAGVSVNQTVATTIAVAMSNLTDAPTRPGPSPDLNISGYSIPLSAFTSKAQMNTTTPTSNDSVILPPGEVSSPAAPTPFPRTFPVTLSGGDSVWTTATHVVIAVEQKEVEEEVPDIIILGPSVPVVLIFVIVVAGIAWWNYKFNSEELNRFAVLHCTAPCCQAVYTVHCPLFSTQKRTSPEKCSDLRRVHENGGPLG